MNQSGSSRHSLGRRQALWLMAGAAGSISLHACNQSAKTSAEPSAAPSEANRTAAAFGSAPWIGCTPLYIAQAKAFFREAGLDLDIKTFASNLESIPSFSVGQIQGCAPLPTSEAVTVAAKNIDFRVVGVMDLSAGGDAILARNSITDIKDFKGKQIAVQVGGLGHFFLLQILAEAGLSGKDVTLVNTTPDAAATAYQTGKVDIAYTYSPFLEKANQAQPDGRIIYDTSKMPTAIIDLYVVSAKLVETQPETVQAFLKGIFRGQEFLQTHADEAYAIAAKQLGIEPSEVAAQLKGVRLPDLKTNIEMLSNAQSNLYLMQPLQSMAGFLKDQKQIETIPDLSHVLDPQFVTALNTAV